MRRHHWNKHTYCLRCGVERKKKNPLCVKQFTAAAEQIKTGRGIERFTMPTDKQMIDIALIFNGGKLDREQLINTVSAMMFILDRLHENGDVTMKSEKED